MELYSITQGDVVIFLNKHCGTSRELLHAILRGLSENTIKYRPTQLLGKIGGTIEFADGSSFYPTKVLNQLIKLELIKENDGKQ